MQIYCDEKKHPIWKLSGQFHFDGHYHLNDHTQFETSANHFQKLAQHIGHSISIVTNNQEVLWSGIITQCTEHSLPLDTQFRITCRPAFYALSQYQHQMPLTQASLSDRIQSLARRHPRYWASMDCHFDLPHTLSAPDWCTQTDSVIWQQWCHDHNLMVYPTYDIKKLPIYHIFDHHQCLADYQETHENLRQINCLSPHRRIERSTDGIVLSHKKNRHGITTRVVMALSPIWPNTRVYLNNHPFHSGFYWVCHCQWQSLPVQTYPNQHHMMITLRSEILKKPTLIGRQSLYRAHISPPPINNPETLAITLNKKTNMSVSVNLNQPQTQKQIASGSLQHNTEVFISSPPNLKPIVLGCLANTDNPCPAARKPAGTFMWQHENMHWLQTLSAKKTWEQLIGNNRQYWHWTQTNNKIKHHLSCKKWLSKTHKLRQTQTHLKQKSHQMQLDCTHNLHEKWKNHTHISDNLQSHNRNLKFHSHHMRTSSLSWQLKAKHLHWNIHSWQHQGDDIKMIAKKFIHLTGKTITWSVGSASVTIDQNGVHLCAPNVACYVAVCDLT